MEEVAGGLIGGAADIVGAQMQDAATEKINQQNIDEENYLASNSIQLKVDDAAKAGINPLYALGGSAAAGPAQEIAPTALGQGVQKAGQDISRAITSTMSAEDRKRKDEMDAQNLQKARLSNDLLKVQIANAAANQPQNPPMPVQPVVMNRLGNPNWSGVSGVEAKGYPKGLPQDSDSVYKYYNVPGSDDRSWADLGVSPSDVSRGLTNWFHWNRLYQHYSGQ